MTIESKQSIIDIIREYLVDLYEQRPSFTGRLELNFKDGQLMDINETKRTKIKE